MALDRWGNLGKNGGEHQYFANHVITIVGSRGKWLKWEVIQVNLAWREVRGVYAFRRCYRMAIESLRITSWQSRRLG
jgi:hypothetical protein